jgi:hypothetical protein
MCTQHYQVPASPGLLLPLVLLVAYTGPALLLLLFLLLLALVGCPRQAPPA